MVSLKKKKTGFKVAEVGFMDSSDTLIWGSHPTSLSPSFLICKKGIWTWLWGFLLKISIFFLISVTISREKTISRLILWHINVKLKLLLDCKKLKNSTRRDHFYCWLFMLFHQLHIKNLGLILEWKSFSNKLVNLKFHRGVNYFGWVM